MRILPVALVFLVASLSETTYYYGADAKSPSRSTSVGRSSSSSRRSSSRSSSSRPASSSASVSRRRSYQEDEQDEDEIDADFDMEEEEDYEEDMYDDEEEEEEEVLRPTSKRRSSGSRTSAPPKRSSRKPPPVSSSRSRTSSRKSSRRFDDYDDEYDRPPPRRSSGGRPPSSSRRGGPPPRRGGPPSSRDRRGYDRSAVVPYGPQTPSAFSRGLTALRDAIPDPGAVRDATTKTFIAAKDTSSKLSSSLYREIKGLTSSELEQVMLKATRPDDTPVKGKHVERLVGVTYQVSARYDIYDAVLRKLWGKMAEKDWRTTVKALYILHRFSADGAPEHQAALKARLRELRRTRDPKRKDKYFNSKQLLAGDTTPENVKFRAFLSRYAHYVLLRAQCFGGMFDEISADPSAGKSSKKPQKPITSTALRPEHLEAAQMLLKAGTACQLKDGEECENTAIAAERVASDMIGLTTAVAMALNRALKGDNLKGADPAIIKRWCEFYSEELLPQTKSMVKKTAGKLDAYGLFLPSRMGASVSQEILLKGLKLAEVEAEISDQGEDTKEEVKAEVVVEETVEDDSTPKSPSEAVEDEEVEEGSKGMEEDEYDEYDYEEEEYYDDEEE